MTTGIRLTVLSGGVFALLHLAFIFSTSSLDPLLAAVAGVLYSCSLGIFWSAIAANRVKPLAACFSNEDQLHLVQHGPYRFVRHPFYCSYLLTWLAGAVATWSAWLGLTFAIMFVLYVVAAGQEERKFAQSPLSAAYAKYRNRTGQFFPRPHDLLSDRHP